MSIQIIVPPGTDVEVQYRPADPPPPPPPSGNSALEQLIASMAPGEWRKLTPQPAGMDDALYDPVGVLSGNNNGILPYAGSTAPGYIVGADHGGRVKLVRYDQAANSWAILKNPDTGSHAYQHCCADDAGNVYKLVIGDRKAYKWDGADWDVYADMATLVNANHIATAMSWWNGALHWYDGNTGKVWRYSGTSWTVAGSHPDQAGCYHNVCAPTSAGLVFGGGNNFQANFAHTKELYLLAPSGTVTRLPDAPYKVGIYSGMQLVGDGTGSGVLLFGFGEAWRWTPATGMVRVADPPATMLQPNIRQAPGGGYYLANSIMSWAGAGYVVTVQYDRFATPKTAMHVFKA